MTAIARALAALHPLTPDEQLTAAARWLAGGPVRLLEGFERGTEIPAAPARVDGRVDGRLLEVIAARALGGARGAVFTPGAEARLLAALGLARVAARRGVPEDEALAALCGDARDGARTARALDGARVLDPCCGGGALLVAAWALARRCGFALALHGIDVAPVAARAASLRLSLAGARASITCADALEAPWPDADLLLSNPPFLRHEALTTAEKERAARATGLSRQADLSAHLARLAIARAPEVALVWPRALDVARSAEPLLAEARARGGFVHRLRSRTAGSFAASVDTVLAVWSLGQRGRPRVESRAALGALTPAEIAGLARGVAGPRLRRLPEADAAAPGDGRASHAPGRVRDVCEVRFGMKTGCNAFFHLRPLGGARYESAAAGEVRLAPGDALPLVASLRDAVAPEVAHPRVHLFRPLRSSPEARRYVAAGEALGISRRPTCAARAPWWMVAPGRAPAPVLYPAKIGARAFALLNEAGWWEDKKWHALFPREGVEAWVLATALGATPIRLAVDRAARQLTGAQAIADVDCRHLAAAPFPDPRALAGVQRALADCRAALARDAVTTDVAAMLDRPAQGELDRIVGAALGMGPRAIGAARREMLARVAARLEHAASVRAAIAADAG